jgi:hypothetical protein
MSIEARGETILAVLALISLMPLSLQFIMNSRTWHYLAMECDAVITTSTAYEPLSTVNMFCTYIGNLTSRREVIEEEHIFTFNTNQGVYSPTKTVVSIISPTAASAAGPSSPLAREKADALIYAALATERYQKTERGTFALTQNGVDRPIHQCLDRILGGKEVSEALLAQYPVLHRSQRRDFVNPAQWDMTHCTHSEIGCLTMIQGYPLHILQINSWDLDPLCCNDRQNNLPCLWKI